MKAKDLCYGGYGQECSKNEKIWRPCAIHHQRDNYLSKNLALLDFQHAGYGIHIFKGGNHNKLPAGGDGYVFKPNDQNPKPACHRQPGKNGIFLS